MTTRQSFAIFCKTKVDIRGCNITPETLDKLFKLNNEDAAKLAAGLPGAIVKGTAKTALNNWPEVYREACNAGVAAGNGFRPEPMIVAAHSNPLDDNSPITNKWFVSDGVCGFASVVISDGRSSFATWCRKNNIGSRDYYGGWSIWIHDHNQSLQRKEAHATAFAEILNKHGIKCRISSRMD